MNHVIGDAIDLIENTIGAVFDRAHTTPYKIALDSFPTTVTSKIQKYLTREAVIARLGLKEQRTA